MSVVVRRCPQCGSVQDVPGECGTCHEADVRFYCPNHTPGRWLVASSCPDCGARLDRDPVPSTPAPPPREVPREVPREIPRERARERAPEPFPEPEPPRPWIDVTDVRDVPPRRRRAVPVPAGPGSDYVELPEIPEAVRRGASSFAGCLLRLVIIALVLFLLVMGAGFLWVIRR